MTFLIGLVFLLSWTAAAAALPHGTFEAFSKRSKAALEASGSEPDEALRGVVKVVRLDPRALAQSGFFRRGLSPRGAPSLGARASFPAFLSQGRPGPAPGGPLRHLSPKSSTKVELKKKQGLQMWQRAVDKGDKVGVSLPLSLKDATQTCSAVAFTQRVTADGCEAATVHNKLCFGQCSSLFVPSDGDLGGAGPPPHRTAPCSRCAPSRARTVAVPLRCGAETRHRSVMVVEECRCETGREERSAEAAALTHLR
ncbi:DAN domain family member 5 [Betta splendens]|uniref:DAN domain family member 5 n=1 Tax=Betta splendens TaxID=158456 RepID=A0A6P7KY71_BETSP|nr:DAN domain family member 5 [Betta splendens]